METEKKKKKIKQRNIKKRSKDRIFLDISVCSKPNLVISVYRKTT